MNIKQKIKTFFAYGAIFAGLAVAALGQTESPAQPENAWGDPHVRAASFGLQTLDAGRTLRLGVVNAAPPPVAARDYPNSPEAEPIEYRVKVNFDTYSVRAADGSVRFLRRVSREATLAPGEGLSFDFTASAADGSVRVAATAFVLRLGENAATDRAERISTTLEMRDSRSTLFISPGTIRGFNPQPDPPQN